MKTFSLIVAMDARFGIGKGGGLPWHLPADLKHFKAITTRTQYAEKRNAVIMGRKTWESLPAAFRPLPQRVNIVLTGQENYPVPMEVYRAASLDQSLDMAVTQLKFVVEDVYVIGGGKIFEEAVRHPLCHKLYVTHLMGHYECDTFFPRVLSRFRKTSQSENMKDGDISYFFAEYIRMGE